MPHPVFFTDRNLGRRFPTILRTGGLAVEAHDDHFEQVTRDIDWLPVVGERKWVVLTRDKRISYTPAEKDVLMRARVRLFVLIGRETTEALAQNFVHTSSRVAAFLDRNPDPFIARVYMARGEAFRQGRPGEIRSWLTWAEWLQKEGGSGR